MLIFVKIYKIKSLFECTKNRGLIKVCETGRWAHINVKLLHFFQSVHKSEMFLFDGVITSLRSDRLTTSCCAPSWFELIMNMQNRLVHHLVRTKLHCTPPKCMSVQNYMVHNTGRWCTMLSCTVEVVLNIALTNSNTQTHRWV